MRSSRGMAQACPELSIYQYPVPFALPWCTQVSNLDAVRGLAKYYKRSPGQLNEEEIRRFFLHLINDRHCVRSTVTIYLRGIKFFFETTLKREWTVFKLVRPAPSHKLPPVLSREEVRAILRLVRKPITRMVLTLIYSCGLRLSEGARLKVEDIAPGLAFTLSADSDRPDCATSCQSKITYRDNLDLLPGGICSLGISVWPSIDAAFFYNS